MTRNYGVSIGINGYRFSSLTSLKYAKRDAMLFASFLEKDAKFNEVWLFSDDSSDISGRSTTPYRTLLRSFFRNHFSNLYMSKEDSLWLFFSGHGIQHQGIDYMLPIDGDPEDPAETGVSVNFIVESLRKSGAGEIVLVIDMCRTEGRKGANLESRLYHGVTTIFSCKPNESSWEINAPISQGAFTYALLQNLKQQVNGKPSTVADTEAALQQEVAILTREHGKPRQTPHIRCESAVKANSFLFSPAFLKARGFFKKERKIPYLELSRKRTTLSQREHSRIISFKKEALAAEEAKNFGLAQELWERVIRADASEQESYIRAIKRITEALVLQPYQITEQDTHRQLAQQPTQVERDSNNQRFQKGIDRAIQLYDLSGFESSLNFTEYRYSFQALDATDNSVELFNDVAYCLTEKVSDVEIEMVLIPGGNFLMGSSERKPNSSELPKHEVAIKTCLISKHPITKQQWKAIARQSQITRKLKLRPSLRGSKYYPAVAISWYEAVEFCNRLTKMSGHEYRLPTEAEWEYACRAGSTSSFHFGSYMNHKVAHFDSESATEVCQFLPNAFGLNDMHGNIWEWCMDHWHPDFTNAPSDGTAWLDPTKNLNRVLRGGSWRNEVKLCRSACRFFDDAESRTDSTGFRIVRSL